MAGGAAVANAASAPALARVDLFSALTPGELESLSARVRRRRYAKGSVLFFEGDTGDCLYVVESGHVKMVLTSAEGKELVLAWRGPGEFFGDMALLDGEPRSCDAVVADDCQLLLLQRDEFIRFVETHPRAAVHLLAELCRRLRESMHDQQYAAQRDVSARLARKLLQLAEDRGAGDTGVVTVELPITQAELATQIGVTRESVNKWLRFYQRKGWIRWSKGQLTIFKPHELRNRLS